MGRDYFLQTITNSKKIHFWKDSNTEIQEFQNFFGAYVGLTLTH